MAIDSSAQSIEANTTVLMDLGSPMETDAVFRLSQIFVLNFIASMFL
jgi:hypothetical protein